MSGLIEALSGGFPNSRSGRNQEENIIINEIAREISRNLNIDNSDGEIFMRLMKHNLEKILLGRDGQLERYYNNKLEKLLPDFYRRFDLEAEQLEINKNHTDDSKLWNIMEAIQKKYDIKSPKRSKMPNYFGPQSGMDECTTESPGGSM